MKQRLLLLSCLLLSTGALFAQNVGIGTATPTDGRLEIEAPITPGTTASGADVNTTTTNGAQTIEAISRLGRVGNSTLIGTQGTLTINQTGSASPFSGAFGVYGSIGHPGGGTIDIVGSDARIAGVSGVFGNAFSADVTERQGLAAVYGLMGMHNGGGGAITGGGRVYAGLFQGNGRLLGLRGENSAFMEFLPDAQTQDYRTAVVGFYNSAANGGNSGGSTGSATSYFSIEANIPGLGDSDTEDDDIVMQFLTDEGNVGIGLANPIQKLDVEGAGRFTTTNAGANTIPLYVRNGSGALQSAAEIRFQTGNLNTGGIRVVEQSSVDEDGRMEFYLSDDGNYERKVQILNRGEVRISSLEGTGIRAVYADANGELIVDAADGCVGGVNAYPYTESFEGGLGQWNQSTTDDQDWTRQTGGTGSVATGPTGASAGGFYLYTEASGGGFPFQDFMLDGPCFNLSDMITPSFEFDYQMSGNTMGSLALQVSIDSGNSWETVWERAGEQSDGDLAAEQGRWYRAKASLGKYINRTVRVRIWARSGNNFRSDIAIDNIRVEDDYRPAFISGNVEQNGTVRNGSGFTITRVNVGVYDIFYGQAFDTEPSVTVSQVYPDFTTFGLGGSTLDNCLIGGISTTRARVICGDGGGNRSDREFSFIIMSNDR